MVPGLTPSIVPGFKPGIAPGFMLCRKRRTGTNGNCKRERHSISGACDKPNSASLMSNQTMHGHSMTCHEEGTPAYPLASSFYNSPRPHRKPTLQTVLPSYFIAFAKADFPPPPPYLLKPALSQSLLVSCKAQLQAPSHIPWSFRSICDGGWTSTMGFMPPTSSLVQVPGYPLQP